MVSFSHTRLTSSMRSHFNGWVYTFFFYRQNKEKCMPSIRIGFVEIAENTIRKPRFSLFPINLTLFQFTLLCIGTKTLNPFRSIKVSLFFPFSIYHQWRERKGVNRIAETTHSYAHTHTFTRKTTTIHHLIFFFSPNLTWINSLLHQLSFLFEKRKI